MQTTILLKNFVLYCRIGIQDQEQHIRQPVQFTVEVTLAQQSVPQTLEQSVCYYGLSEFIRTLSATHIPLVETMASMILDYCLAQPNAQHAMVAVEKLAIIPKAGSVGCRVEASKV
jgi:dihydroneopterin aldolase